VLQAQQQQVLVTSLCGCHAHGTAHAKLLTNCASNISRSVEPLVGGGGSQASSVVCAQGMLCLMQDQAIAVMILMLHMVTQLLNSRTQNTNTHHNPLPTPKGWGPPSIQQ
jgi:hypothetical protein